MCMPRLNKNVVRIADPRASQPLFSGAGGRISHLDRPRRRPAGPGCSAIACLTWHQWPSGRPGSIIGGSAWQRSPAIA